MITGTAAAPVPRVPLPGQHQSQHWRHTTRRVRMSRSRWQGIAWVVPALVMLAVFVYLPLAQSLGFSTLEWDIFTGTQEFVGISNFEKLTRDPIFWSALLNNLWFALVSIAVQVFGAMVLAATIESVRRARLRNALRAIYFVPSAISLTVAGLLFYFIYQPDVGLLNSALDAIGLGSWAQAWLGQESTAIWGIIAMSQWQGFGYTSLLFAIAIQRIPSELYEAALIDGIGQVRRFFMITMPLVREMTALMMIVTISGAFQVFNEVMVMTSGGPNNSSQVLVTWLYRSGFVRNNFGYASAIATVIFVITLGLALFQLWVSHKRRVQW